MIDEYMNKQNNRQIDELKEKQMSESMSKWNLMVEEFMFTYMLMYSI